MSQLSMTGPFYTRRPDLVGFVNGLPVVVIELKKPGVPARQAFDDNLTCYNSDISQLFWFNGLMIASNGTESRVGSLTADWEQFFEWKRIEREDEPRRVSLEVMLRGTCEPTRLLDLMENFTLFSEHKAGLVKVLGQNHQFLGVNNAISAMLAARKQSHGRGGVFWQAQGSGKSLAMVFFAQKILRKIPGNWTSIVVTDRVELDEEQEKRLERELGRQYQILTRDDRLETIAKDIVQHFLGRGFQGKAMVISIDKATALRMHEEALDEKFKDSNDPLRLVFVCAMWLTGFDAPSCSTFYLDKPMRNHTLMQTIARADRVFPGKHSGLIVDYANVFESLEKALAIYAKGKGGERPIRDKQKLVDSLRQAITEATAFCQAHGVSLETIERISAGSLDRLTKIAEALISPDPLRKDFLAQERWVRTLFQAVKPDPSVLEFASRVACLTTIAASIHDRTGEGAADISAVMTDLNTILDASVAADGFYILYRQKCAAVFERVYEAYGDRRRSIYGVVG